MSDLISRKDLLNAIWRKEYGKDYDGVNMLGIPHIDIIENMPSYNSIKTELNGDLISRKAVLEIFEKHCSNSNKEHGYLKAWCDVKVLSTYPAEQSYSWCKGCEEYDTEKHCCHRYSSFIRESLQENINAVLKDIKAEIREIQGEWYQNAGRYNCIDETLKIIDKHISGKE